MDFTLSSQTHAIKAVDLLRAAGYENAHHGTRGPNVREHIISVPEIQSGVAFEVTRLVQAVDPDAQPLS